MKNVKVLVVDDSAFMRKVLSDILNNDPRIDVVGTARNGEDGVSKAIELEPDVVTLDIEMPKMNGLEALERLMKEKPMPVVMVSSLTSEGAESTVQAITLGAVDFILKPSGSISLDINKMEHVIVRKIIIASKANVLKSLSSNKNSNVNPVPLRTESTNKKTVVAVGTSTGGPRALQAVLTTLPKDLGVPVVIVQHMPKGFTQSLANRLNQLSEITVKEAEHGEPLTKGIAYIAPGDYHMGIVVEEAGDLKIELEQSPPQSGHRPSVNHLYQSLSTLDLYTIAVVMTGMGADGTEGLIQLKNQESSTYVIAESEETSIVFGMPRAVITSKLANEVVPVDKISESILKAIYI
ncbi:protein-glutamate methylesterase/protein-glutamine glutaminase [Halobacillus seohaensis]|uniref:Protein-glutamate methylesterase/protein-glutamine glutaminase n=1 Tax=Halobacillus seohaensis TaxID=447421 RepID=A0ABW2EI54_9BACI